MLVPLPALQDTTNNHVYTGEKGGLSMEDERMQARGRGWRRAAAEGPLWLAALGGAFVVGVRGRHASAGRYCEQPYQLAVPQNRAVPTPSLRFSTFCRN